MVTYRFNHPSQHGSTTLSKVAQEVDTITGEVVTAHAHSTAFDKLASAPGVITKFGHDLVKGEEFDDLTGVDLLITRLTVRKGVSRPAGSPFTSLDGGFISFELITNPEQRIKVINRCRVASGLERITSLADLAFDMGDALIFNDGGTGIYRQAVAILEEEGYIEVPDAPVQGPKGFTKYDTVPEEWEILKGQPVEREGEPFLGYTTDILIRATRGIRLSRYKGDFPGEATTRYIS